MIRKIILIICVSILTVGCGNNSSTTNNNDLKVDSKYSYVYDTDCQCNVGEYPYMAYTKDGTYYFDINDDFKILRFTDKQSGKDVPVCSKVECFHNDVECNAYFDEKEYPMSGLWYLEGCLYVPKVEEDYIKIEKIEADGSGRMVSCTVTRLFMEAVDMGNGVVESSTTYPEIQLHRGYAYVSTYYPGEPNASLYRIKLNDNSEPEEITSIEKQNGGMVMLYRVKPYGSSVFFQMGEYKDNKNTVSIYEYDTITGEVSVFCEQVLRNYFVFENVLYYMDSDDNILKMVLTSEESELFYANDNKVANAVLSDDKLFENAGNLVYRREIQEINEDDNYITYWIDIVFGGDGKVIEEKASDGTDLIPIYIVE